MEPQDTGSGPVEPGGAGRAGPVAVEPVRGLPDLSKGVLFFRIASLVWMATFNLIAGQFRRPALALVALVVAAAWTAWLAIAPGRQERLPVMLIDLALSTGLILVSGLVVAPGATEHGRLVFATAYPVTTALLWGMARGPAGGLAAGACLSVALVCSRPINGVAFRHLSQFVSLGNGAAYFLMAGGTMGVISRALNRSAAEVRQASEAVLRARERAARTAERASLRRQIHDSVLQVLALMSKRGRELGQAAAVPGTELLRFAELAGEQERVLRDLINQEAEDAPAGMASLREALRVAARAVSGIPVTVSCPDPMWLPARLVQELSAGTRQALDNVVEHARATKAAVFAEREEGWLTVAVRDNGRGFTFDETRLRQEGSFGLFGMRSRMEDLGGRMRLVSAPDLGTEVEFRVPADLEQVPAGQATTGAARRAHSSRRAGRLP